MLKNFFKAALLAVAAVCGLASCGDKTADYDALRPTLLGGVYFYRGYGGVDAVDAQLKSEALSQLDGYKEYFLDPYKKSKRQYCYHDAEQRLGDHRWCWSQGTARKAEVWRR